MSRSLINRYAAPFFRRTPGPPPFSAMNSTPAASSADPDAAYLRNFAAYTLSDAERDDIPFGDLPDATVSTMTGALAKLYFAAWQMWDPYQIEHADEPLPRALASLQSSAANFPEPFRSALAIAADTLEGTARDHCAAIKRHAALKDAAENRKDINDIFERYGVNAQRAENARQSQETEAGRAQVQRFTTALEEINIDNFQWFADYMIVKDLHDKAADAWEVMAERDLIGARPMIHRTAARRIVTGLLTRSLDAGGGGRRLSGLRLAGNINSELSGAGATIAGRAAALAHNDPHIRAGIDALAAHLVGTGFIPTSKHDALKRAWRCLVRRADPAGRLDLDGLAKLAAVSMIRDGECFILIHPVDDPSAPLRLELLHRDQCPMDRFAETLPDFPGHRVRAGIEFDESNRPVAYHFLTHRPGDVTAPFDGNGWKTVRVSAENVLHLFHPIEIGQIRGLSWLSPVVLTAHTANAYRDAALEKAKTAALMTGFIRDPEGDAAGLPGTFANGVLTVGMEPGALIPVPTGSDITFSDPPQNTDFDPFMKSVLRSIAVGMGCTYEQVSGDLSATTFSSARVGLLEFRRKMEPLQYEFAHQFYDPIWRRMVALLALSGAVDAPGFLDDPEEYLSVEWLPPRWDYVNPAQDVNADIAAIDAGLKSRTQAVAERGYDITAIDRERTDDATRERLLTAYRTAEQKLSETPDA